jgi:hypothetical protein
MHDLDLLPEKIIGVAAPLLGVITSFQEQVEFGLRVASLSVGLMIGLLSLFRILFRKQR